MKLAKSSGGDAWTALKQFAGSPVAGLPVAFKTLGPKRALGVGIVFGAAFALCLIISAYRLFEGMGGSPNIFKVIVVAIVPAIALFGVVFGARNIFRGPGEYGHDSFVAGACLVPFGVAVLISAIAGLGNTDLMILVNVFAFCLTAMMLFSGMTRICGLSERAGAWMVPLMLLVTVWISKLVYAAMFRQYMGG